MIGDPDFDAHVSYIRITSAHGEQFVTSCQIQHLFTVSLPRLAYAVRRHLYVPDVIVDVLHEDQKLFIVVKNIGQGPAHQVSVSFDPEVWGVRGTVQISSLPLFENLSFLAPGKELRTFLDVSSAYFNRDEPRLIDVTVKFEDDTGTRFKRSLTHNLSVYRATGPP